MKTHSLVDVMLLAQGRKIERNKASFNIDKRLFSGFKALCERHGRTQTEVLEAMFEDLLKKHGERPQAAASKKN